MDIFSQKRFLQRLVLLLFVSNLILAGFYLWKMNETRRGKEIAPRPVAQQELPAVLQKELGLTDSQALVLKSIRSSFFEKEKLLSDTIRQKRDSMNQLMFSGNAVDSLLKQLGKTVSDYEYKMELLRVEQARQVRNICTPDQQQQLEKLVREIRDYLKPETGKK